MRSVFWSLTTFALVGMTVSADEKSNERAREAWQDYQKVQADYGTEYSKAYKEYRETVKAKPEDAAAARKKLNDTITPLRETLTKAQELFGKAFAESDWSSWDAEKDAKLLEMGLFGASRSAMEEGNLDQALKALEALTAKLPKSRYGSYSKMLIGDLQIAKGDLEKGLKTYKALEEGGDARQKTDAAQRLALVGKTAPDVDSEKWIGGEAKALSALKGKVVVVDFWATWCGPCRVVMPGLSKLYAKHKDDGLMVMGLTRFYANGYLPENPEQMMTGGASVRGMDQKKYLEHVKAFRDNTKMSYPFVIGEADNFKDYKVRGIPTVAVVGVDGKIALLAVGSGSEPLVRAVVERELKKIKK